MPVKSITNTVILDEYAKVTQLSQQLYNIFRGVDDNTLCISSAPVHATNSAIASTQASYTPYLLFGDSFINSLGAFSSYMMLHNMKDAVSAQVDAELFRAALIHYRDRINTFGIKDGRIGCFTTFREHLEDDQRTDVLATLDQLEDAAVALYDDINLGYPDKKALALLGDRIKREGKKSLKTEYDEVLAATDALGADTFRIDAILPGFSGKLKELAPIFENPLADERDHKQLLQDFVTYCKAHEAGFNALHIPEHGETDLSAHQQQEAELAEHYGISDLHGAQAHMETLTIACMELCKHIQRLFEDHSIASGDAAAKHKRSTRTTVRKG